MFQTILKQLRADRSILWFNCFTLLVFLAITVYVKLHHRGELVVLLFTDPFLAKRPYIGTLSALAELLWCISVTICVCSFRLLQTIQPGKKVNRFLLCSAIGIGVLLIDDVFRIHLILKSVGIPRIFVYLVYGIATLAYGLTFWRIIRVTPYSLLLLAGVLFTISGVVDSIPLPGQGTRAMLEDGTRLLGTLNLTLYFKQVGWQVVLQSLRQGKRLPSGFDRQSAL